MTRAPRLLGRGRAAAAFPSFTAAAVCPRLAAALVAALVLWPPAAVPAAPCARGTSAAGVEMPSQAEVHAARMSVLSGPLEEVARTPALDAGEDCVAAIREMFHVEIVMPSFTWRGIRDALVRSGQELVETALCTACQTAASSASSWVSGMNARINEDVVRATGSPATSAAFGSRGLRIRVNDLAASSTQRLRGRLAGSISSLAHPQ